MDTGDWRIQLRLDSRKRIVDKMYVQVLQNSKFFIYMKEKENDKGLIKISRIALRQPQVSHTSFFFFFFIFSCVSHEKQTWGNIKCWEVIFVGISCVISSFDDDLLDGCIKLVPLLISRLIYCYEHTCFNLKLELQLNLNEWCWIWAFYLF